jgi:hypothetical protein
MRKGHDNERVSNERLNASRLRDKYDLALTPDDGGLLVLRFHTGGAPAVFTGQTHEDFPAALEEISLDRGNKALGDHRHWRLVHRPDRRAKPR